MLELESNEILEERQFQLAIRRLADSLSHGADASPFRGSGIEYEQSRLYQPGDPVKLIDWRLTARTRKVHVKEYQAPKRLPVWLLVDTSASMCVGSGRLSKYAWAVQLAGGLSLAALARISPVGVLGCGERPIDFQPTLSRNRVMLWLHALRRFRADEGTRLTRRIRELGRSAGPRSLVIVLSDLHDQESLEALATLAQRHDLIVLQFWDPAEAGRLGGGILRIQEAETGRSSVAHGRQAWLEPDGPGRFLRSHGVDHLLIDIRQPMIPVLRGFLARRGVEQRGKR